MEFIIELIVELIFEGSFELSKSKKTPKWLRYPLIIIIALFFIAVFLIILLTGYLALKEMPLLGIILIILGIFMTGHSIYRFKNIYLKRNPNSEESKIWNTFIEQVCTKKLKDLTDLQKKAVICFWYDCEMQSGGHSGVFDVYPIFKKKSNLVYDYLKELCNKKIADNYLDAFNNLDSDFEVQDNKYNEFSPCVTEYLEEYVLKNKEDILK